MNFLHPGLALAGALAVSIPVIIHLLMRRRRKPVMWGAMRFLLEAYRRQRRRLMLEKWLLLAARCLLVLLVGLAIGRPLLGLLGKAGGGRTIYILIDTGLASSATGEDGRTSALDRHKAMARRVLAELGGGGGGTGGGGAEADRAALIAMGGPAEGLVTPPSTDLRAVGALIDELRPTDSTSDIVGALALAASSIGNADAASNAGEAGPSTPPRHARNDRTVIVLLSDFLEGSADLNAALGRLPEGVRVAASEPAAAPDGVNVSITGIEPLRSVFLTGDARTSTGPGVGSGAGVGEQVRVMLRRSGPGMAREGVTAVSVRIAAAAPAPGGAGGSGAGDLAEGRAVLRWTPGQEEATVAVQAPAPPPASGPLGASDRGGGGAGGGGDGGNAGGNAGGNGGAVILARIDTDTIAGDNLFRRPIEVRDALRVGIVAQRRFGERARVDELDAAEWVRLALRPAEVEALGDGGEGGGGGGVQTVDVEPTALDTPRLAGLDAAVITRPDLVPSDAWSRLRQFADGGGLIVVMPPADVKVHVWSDPMVSALGLPFRIAREATGGTAPAPQPGPPARLAAGGGGGGNGGGKGELDLLALIRGELEDLARPVSVTRFLPIESQPSASAGAAGEGQRVSGDAAGGQTLLTLDDGTPIVWAGRPGAADATMPAQAAAAEAGGAGRGLVVYIATAITLGWTDLPARPLMVPLVQEIIRQGIGRAHGAGSAIAGRSPALPSRTVELRRAAGPGPDEQETTLRVGQGGVAEAPIRRAGLWRALDERGALRAVIAVNADPQGGRAEPRPRAEVERWLAAASAPPAGGPAEGGPVIWLGADDASTSGAPTPTALSRTLAAGPGGSGMTLPLLIAAAAVALFEMVLARSASHAEVARPAAARPGLASPMPRAAGVVRGGEAA